MAPKVSRSISFATSKEIFPDSTRTAVASKAASTAGRNCVLISNKSSSIKKSAHKST